MFSKKTPVAKENLTHKQKIIKAVIKLALVLAAQLVFIGFLVLFNDSDVPILSQSSNSNELIKQ
jgi:amino acid permease